MPGVEGFVPARLRMARNARALLQKELAELVERDVTSVLATVNVVTP